MVGLWLKWEPCARNTCAEHDLCTKITTTADGSGLKEVRNGKVKGEFSWFKSVFFEAIRLWEQQDQLLRKSSQSKLLKMVLESKEMNKQLVIVLCQSLIGACFCFEIRLRLNFAENLIFNLCVFV